MTQLIIIAGTVGKDAVLRQTQSDPVLGFSIAVNNGKDTQGVERPTTWYDCSLWGKRGEALARYITKGSKLTVTGRPTVRVHEGKAYLGVSVNEVTLMGGGQSRDESRDDSSYGRQDDRPAARSELDSEIPF